MLTLSYVLKKLKLENNMIFLRKGKYNKSQK